MFARVAGLVTVAVRLLDESLVTVSACVGSKSTVCTDVVQYVTDFAELLATLQALEDLIPAIGIRVSDRDLLIALVFRDDGGGAGYASLAVWPN